MTLTLPIDHPAPGESHPGAWLIVTAIALVSAAIGFSIGALGPSLPVLQDRLHAPLDQLGLLFGASFAGSLVATAILGPLLDRRPPRPLLVTGVTLMLLGQLSLPLATTLPQAVLALALTGVGGGANSIGGAVLTTRLFGAHGGRALSMTNMSFGLGAFTGPLVAAAVLGRVHDYRPLFVGVSVALLVPLVVYLGQSMPGPGPRQTSGAGLPPGYLPPICLLGAVAFLYLGTEIGFGGWIFTYVRQTTAATVSLASWSTASYWLALAVSSLGAAVRPRRIQAEWLVLGCATGATMAALALLLTQGSSVSSLVSATLLGLCLGPIYPLTMASAAGLVPAVSGRLAAVVIASSQLGGSVLPWVQGILLARGPAWCMVMAAVACLSMSVLQLGYLRARHVDS